MDNWRRLCHAAKGMELEVIMGGSIPTGTLEITPDILKLIAEIDEFKARGPRSAGYRRIG